MDPHLVRYLVTARLLDAAGPVPLAELVTETNLPRPAVLGALWDLVGEGRVAEAPPDQGRPRYEWAEREAGARAPGSPPPIDGRVVREFVAYVRDRYRPPAPARFLVLLQDSVRRPFPRSPSHASFRRAVAVATGADPGKEPTGGTVHVAVLASRIGVVPYDLAEVWPATVRAGGLPGMSQAEFARVRPALVRRTADYLRAHGGRDERVAGFGAGRYGEVLLEAGEAAGRSFPVFPGAEGRRVISLSGKRLRTCWETHWIRLADEIASWLPARERAEAAERMAALGLRTGHS